MLYRKYRPQTFSEVVGQEHVVRTLLGGLTSGRIGHAFLFAGSRGTGKTSIARIYAKAINCVDFSGGSKKSGNKFGMSDLPKPNSGAKIPCDQCLSCLSVNEGRSLDLIEIDAASNRGIDEIRNIKESAGVASLGGGNKVFLIDEVHMLTKDAFNALLKILEEPPVHVVFILATTEPHKILPTVLSRVQRFDFRKLTQKQIAEKLGEIAMAEKVKITEDALEILAASSDGAMRDAEVALTKLIASALPGEEITAEYVNETLGLIPLQFHPEFFGYLVRQDRPAAIDFIQRIHQSGFDLEYFTKEFLQYLRKIMIMRINPATLAAVGQELASEQAAVLTSLAGQIEPRSLIKMITVFTSARAEMKNSPIAQLPLELAVMELCST